MASQDSHSYPGRRRVLANFYYKRKAQDTIVIRLPACNLYCLALSAVGPEVEFQESLLEEQ